MIAKLGKYHKHIWTHRLLTLIACNILFLITKSSFALTFPLPLDNDTIVGGLAIIKIEPDTTLQAIARSHDVTITELLAANPGLNVRRLRAGKKIIVPSAFVLPNTPRTGIVINLAELRLYFYPPFRSEVMTFPIGVGRDGWETPIGQTTVKTRDANPVWYPPESIRQYTLQTKGRLLPLVVPPGPDNPLGDYALRLALDGYLIHGTNDPSSVGKRSSSGCIRMYAEDIEQLYYQVVPGTPVYIVHEPYKIGRYHNEYYLEAHQPLANYSHDSFEAQVASWKNRTDIQFDWVRANEVANKVMGYPIFIGRGT